MPIPRLQEHRKFFDAATHFRLDAENSADFDQFMKQHVKVERASEEAPIDTKDPMYIAATTGDFGIRTPIGQRFGRMHKR